MEAEITNAGGSPDLTEPHFDDEATVLSARQVVPLDEVPSYESPRSSGLTRKWMFAAIVLGSLLLGVVGGAGYYSYLSRSPAPVLVNTDQLAAGVEGISTEPAVNSNVGLRTAAPAPVEDVTSELSEKEISESLKEPADYPAQTKRAAARRVITLPSDRDEEDIREEREEQIREERKAARKEEKRRKRQLERERKSRNDLTRIREIFEGPQKP